MTFWQKIRDLFAGRRAAKASRKALFQLAQENLTLKHNLEYYERASTEIEALYRLLTLWVNLKETDELLLRLLGLYCREPEARLGGNGHGAKTQVIALGQEKKD